ncbi:MAG: CARDB domain-containing protein, partial [Candidatus Promineifilaceae bacterium]
RIGWYLDYSASASPSEPNGADYAPLISIQQTGPNSYTYNPNGAALSAAVSANPGASWFISNEPDRRDWQDDLEPHIYAASYHELYYLIKNADPTAQIFAGSIVQPTPIRLLYLDMVLDSYWDAYGELMPVDGWSIHNFILNEVSCDYDPDNCWGAEIPPGIDAPYGEILGIQDNDRLDLFIERIVRFRHWMSARGYQGLPLYLSEYGILMPQDFGFPASRVNEYMNNTFDYLLSAADGRHGNPNDEYRLIQKLSWFSTSETFYNGWLYDLVSPGNYELSPMGLNYAAYTAGIPSEIDLYPSILSTDPAAPFSSGDPVTLTLSATIANSGNMITETGSVTVRFYDGDPSSGGVQIGTDQTVSLRGCGDNETVSVTWSDLAPGVYRLFVVVDPEDEIIDSDRNNNTASRLVIVATDRTHTPLIQFTG